MIYKFPSRSPQTVINCCIAAYRFFGDKRNIFIDSNGMKHPGFGPTAVREVSRVAKIYKST